MKPEWSKDCGPRTGGPTKPTGGDPWVEKSLATPASTSPSRGNRSSSFQGMRSPTGRRPWAWKLALVVCLGIGSGSVHAQAPAGDSGQPRDITGIEELPPLPPSPVWPYWLAGVIVAAGLIGFIAWRIACYKPRLRPLPPDRWALQELERITAQKLAEQGQAERFHTLVCDVMRHYLEARYDLRAPQQTTQEFLRSLPEPSPLPAERQEKLAEFLRRCDLAKFAPVTVAAAECGQVLELAKAVVTEASEARDTAQAVGRMC